MNQSIKYAYANSLLSFVTFLVLLGGCGRGLERFHQIFGVSLAVFSACFPSWIWSNWRYAPPCVQKEQQEQRQILQEQQYLNFAMLLEQLMMMKKEYPTATVAAATAAAAADTHAATAPADDDEDEGMYVSHDSFDLYSKLCCVDDD